MSPNDQSTSTKYHRVGLCTSFVHAHRSNTIVPISYMLVL